MIDILILGVLRLKKKQSSRLNTSVYCIFVFSVFFFLATEKRGIKKAEGKVIMRLRFL